MERLDVLAAARWVRKSKQAPSAVAMGLSMGGASTIMAAAADDEGAIDGVWAEAAYASLPELLMKEAEVRYLPRFMATHIVDDLRENFGAYAFALSPAGAAAAIAPRPLMVVVDENDDLIPSWHGDLIFELARQPKQQLVIAGAEHAQGYNRNPQLYARELDRFLKSVFPSE
jgi:fermentation-respiration switch protein FrsA (DUF1100 family)